MAFRISERIENLKEEIVSLEKQLSEKQKELSILLAETPVQEEELNKYAAPIEKVRLFRSLFSGRDDVFAKRFESKVSGQSGYQPACLNEWKEGICEKPRIKCASCPPDAIWEKALIFPSWILYF